jgi:hypothetical protein
MEAIRPSETSVNPSSTQRHIPEDNILQVYICSAQAFYMVTETSITTSQKIALFNIKQELQEIWRKGED